MTTLQVVVLIFAVFGGVPFLIWAGRRVRKHHRKKKREEQEIVNSLDRIAHKLEGNQQQEETDSDA